MVRDLVARPTPPEASPHPQRPWFAGRLFAATNAGRAPRLASPPPPPRAARTHPSKKKPQTPRTTRRRRPPRHGTRAPRSTRDLPAAVGGVAARAPRPTAPPHEVGSPPPPTPAPQPHVQQSGSVGPYGGTASAAVGLPFGTRRRARMALRPPATGPQRDGRACARAHGPRRRGHTNGVRRGKAACPMGGRGWRGSPHHCPCVMQTNDGEWVVGGAAAAAGVDGDNGRRCHPPSRGGAAPMHTSGPARVGEMR